MLPFCLPAAERQVHSVGSVCVNSGGFSSLLPVCAANIPLYITVNSTVLGGGVGGMGSGNICGSHPSPGFDSPHAKTVFYFFSFFRFFFFFFFFFPCKSHYKKLGTNLFLSAPPSTVCSWSVVYSSQPTTPCAPTAEHIAGPFAYLLLPLNGRHIQYVTVFASHYLLGGAFTSPCCKCTLYNGQYTCLSRR